MKRPALWITLGFFSIAALGTTLVGWWMEAHPIHYGDLGVGSEEPGRDDIGVLPKPPIIPPPADGFDFPVGPPDAKKYYNAQGFQKNNHLGEDWNGLGGGNTDLGDPVYATATGIVTFAEDHGPGWGNIVRITHNIGNAAAPILIESLYAHLDQIKTAVGDTVKRGQQIGTIGNAHGAYWAHLHFEMRHKVGMDVGGGYDTDTTGFLVPTAFIKKHRKM